MLDFTGPVHGVLEDGRGGEDQDPEFGVNEWDGIEGGDESGDLAEVAENLERFHSDQIPVSTIAPSSEQANNNWHHYQNRAARFRDDHEGRVNWQMIA